MAGATEAGGAPARHTLIGAAVIRRGGAVLFVRQRGRDDPAPTWSLPGGRVGPGSCRWESATLPVAGSRWLALRWRLTCGDIRR